jgi:antirestriction protein ArdC
MDVCSIVTEKIINLLEQGVIPWRRPWAGGGLPRNVVSKKPYRGINHFLLSASKYVQPYWLTMRQTNDLGGHVRKGEESTVILFWKVEDRQDDGQRQTDANSDEDRRRRFVLRYYRVWNVEQCDLPAVALAELPRIETREHDPIEAIEQIAFAMPNAPALEHAGTKAFYSRINDTVTVPPRNLFVSAEEYGSTILHELTHYAEFRIMRRYFTTNRCLHLLHSVSA